MDRLRPRRLAAGRGARPLLWLRYDVGGGPRHGRSAIGIDIDERNRDLALERVGMWLAEPPRPVIDVQLELVLS